MSPSHGHNKNSLRENDKKDQRSHYAVESARAIRLGGLTAPEQTYNLAPLSPQEVRVEPPTEAGAVRTSRKMGFSATSPAPYLASPRTGQSGSPLKSMLPMGRVARVPW
jgi:hypothetical protein